jgi:hypothetical protein
MVSDRCRINKINGMDKNNKKPDTRCKIEAFAVIDILGPSINRLKNLGRPLLCIVTTPNIKKLYIVILAQIVHCAPKEIVLHTKNKHTINKYWQKNLVGV